MKKILITGGAGFIGLHLSKKLLLLDYKVDILDNFSRGKLDKELKLLLDNKNFNLLKYDLLSEKDLKKIGKNYNFIFHMAAIVGVKNVIKDSYNVLQANVILTLNIIKIAKRQKKLTKILFASTSEVYSQSTSLPSFKIPTPENVPLLLNTNNEKRSSYFLSKIYGECLIQQSNLPFAIFRPHNIYGPRMGMSHVIPELIKKFTKSKNSAVVYSPTHTRSFCFVDDAIEQIYQIMKIKTKKNNLFNIGNPEEEITIKELSLIIKKILNKKHLKIVFKKDNHDSPLRRCPDIKKLAKYKCFKFTSLKLGLIKTSDWYKKNI